MYAMNIQNDVIGLVLRQNCKSKQVSDFIAWPSRCHVMIIVYRSVYNINKTMPPPVKMSMKHDMGELFLKRNR